eukprot:TRINITY_DN2794_c0_g1_i2.p1 TRINITY_DN2794_c0_g1~~TRINITY_DN2794_c0_g1_i2.p1  ORF type:complete len:435 (-),score=81.64 TRINITY_DN2794_c0_g1_i2:75-1379(-)
MVVTTGWSTLIGFLVLLYLQSCSGSNCVPTADGCIPFGKETKEKVFMMDPTALVVNHGSYGGVPRVIFNAEVEWMKKMEENTFYWFLPVMGYRLHLLEAREEIAKYVGVATKDIVLVENASSGINAVLRSLFPLYPHGTKILRLSLAYPMVQHTMSYIAEMGKLEIVDVVVDIPTDEATILKKVREAFEEHGQNGIAFAVFDHIVSMPCAILPIKELIEIAHSYGALTIVDGAHAVGQVPLNLTDINPDFYTSNGHKWLCSPKGSAFLYIKSDHHKIIHPTVISNQYGNGWDLVHQFEYTGTRDYSAFLSLKEALQFRKNLTDSVVWKYNNNLCLEAGKMMSAAWNTTRPLPDSMTASMINVRIPCNTKDRSKGCYTWSEPEMYLWMFGKNVWSLVFPDQSGYLYVRLSCQIYNDMDDYVKLMKVIEEFNHPEQ